MSSFSFLTDAFPNYQTPVGAAATSLYEDFEPTKKNVPATVDPADNDLLMMPEKKKSTNTIPEAFDASSDYYKILASKWEPAKSEEEVQLQLQQQHSSGGCMNVAQHLDQCSDCRARLEQIFRKLLSKPLAVVPPRQDEMVIVKSSSSSSSSWLLEITLLLLLGVFIVFVLDAFVRLGKYFKSR